MKKTLTKLQVIKIIRQHIEDKHAGNQSHYARSLGYGSGEYINQMLRRKADPSKKVLDSVGLVKTTGYQYK